MLQPDTRPHANCYWVVPGRVLAGEYPGAPDPDAARAKVRRHLECGVRTFVDLTEANELSSYETVLASEADAMGVEAEYMRFPIPDVSVPRDPSVMAAVLDAIDAAQQQRPIVYVHCWGGIGRTGTVVGCYFREQGQSGNSALERVSRLWTGVEKYRRRPESPETDEQRAYVRAWGTPTV